MSEAGRGYVFWLGHCSPGDSEGLEGDSGDTRHASAYSPPCQ